MHQFKVYQIANCVFILALATSLSLSALSYDSSTELNNNWEIEQKCPSKLVNFWSTYARKHNDLGSIPAFLITHDCINKTISLDFFSAMKKRFDEPEQKQWRDDLEEALQDNLASL